MKRFYTRAHYLRLVDDLRAARPDLALTTDFIVGFPGEEDEDFEQTLSLLSEAGIVGSFSFKYSPRPGTPALKLVDRDPVPDDVASARLSALQARQRALQLAWNRTHEGRVVDVLVEGPSAHDEGVVCGRTSSNLMVNFVGDEALVGQTLPIRVTRSFTHSVRGEQV
jgi:tRNA-2-methylthio-N6-dimethylallyladenosine synthase